jgi:hypothetical protein
VRQLDFTNTVKFQHMAADFVADALGVFGWVVFHFDLEGEIGRVCDRSGPSRAPARNRERQRAAVTERGAGLWLTLAVPC